jgi:hypothetical protein
MRWMMDRRQPKPTLRNKPPGPLRPGPADTCAARNLGAAGASALNAGSVGYWADTPWSASPSLVPGNQQPGPPLERHTSHVVATRRGAPARRCPPHPLPSDATERRRGFSGFPARVPWTRASAMRGRSADGSGCVACTPPGEGPGG